MGSPPAAWSQGQPRFTLGSGRIPALSVSRSPGPARFPAFAPRLRREPDFVNSHRSQPRGLGCFGCRAGDASPERPFPGSQCVKERLELMLLLKEHLQNSPSCQRSHCKRVGYISSGARAVALLGPRSLIVSFSLEGKVRWDLTTGGQAFPWLPLCCSCCCWWGTCRSDWVLGSHTHTDPGGLASLPGASGLALPGKGSDKGRGPAWHLRGQPHTQDVLWTSARVSPAARPPTASLSTCSGPERASGQLQAFGQFHSLQPFILLCSKLSPIPRDNRAPTCLE